jgi:hypothetical protein
VRALYGDYSGNLYQVTRASDNSTEDIPTLAPGGFADSSRQDSFCAGTACTISIIYDQSPQGNHLTRAPGGCCGGDSSPNPDNEASATRLGTTIGGHPAYAVWIDPGMGYRNDTTSAIATGDEPEGMYMVTSGTHFNGGCCFDYGNAETDNTDTGVPGRMEAIYFGNDSDWGSGAGNGPWVMADLEDGVFSGAPQGLNAADMTVGFDIVTAIVKGQPGSFAIRAGNAQTGSLTTMWSGPRPSGYNPMKKEGAIVLGIGGDNSNTGAGSFYEGCMTSGYPSDTTEDEVQANIVAAGYGR